MRIVILPVSLAQTVQDYIDANSMRFQSWVKRHGTPDPDIIDLGHALQCSVDGSYPATHLLLEGDLTTEQAAWIAGRGIFVSEKEWTEAIKDAGFQLVTEEEPTKDHLMPMPIMHKVWDMADAPIDIAICAESPKWSGYTCCLVYDNKKFIEGTTQGDSIRGHDRTDRLEGLVPATISIRDNVQIEGEVITNTNDESVAYSAMYGATDREFAALGCRFIAFDVRGGDFATWTEAMQYLSDQGFDTVLNHVDDTYPKDGIVYRIDDMAAFASAEIGMFALKFDD